MLLADLTPPSSEVPAFTAPLPGGWAAGAPAVASPAVPPAPEQGRLGVAAVVLTEGDRPDFTHDAVLAGLGEQAEFLDLLRGDPGA